MGSSETSSNKANSEKASDANLKSKNQTDKISSRQGSSHKSNGSSSSNSNTHSNNNGNGGIDAHPFARGSVIQVLYDLDGDARLCDIIDRVPSDTPNHAMPSYRWKYYIHYRDFNRRMDEWITDPGRIISPPSVGNAMVRAALKNMNAKLSEAASHSPKRKRDDNNKDRPRLVRSSSRRSSTASLNETEESTIHATGQSVGNSTNSLSNSTKNNVFEQSSATENIRLTRRQRRRSRAAEESNSNSANNNNSNTNRQSVDVGLVNVWQPSGPNTVRDQVVTVAAQELDEHEGLDEASLREHEEVTKVKNVASIELGRYRMDTWYFSPIPKELGTMLDVLYVCEFTLNFFAKKSQLQRFQQKLSIRNPPGNEIYRNKNLSMFEIDGVQERTYCQNLCYIAKLFLDHKTLYFDVDPFLFYVLCEVDERGFHLVGYFSKEKYSDVGYNLACILTFPCHQRKGYGRFLISFSYELTKKEEKVGSPEKPMSDLGQQAYKPYWTSTIVDFLKNHSESYNSNKNMSVMDISKKTSIMAEDIIFTLNQLGILKYINGVYFITAERNLLEALSIKHPIKEPRVDSSKLHWSPYITDVKRDKFSIHSKKTSSHQET